MNQLHVPVLASEVVETLNPQPGDRILDVTLGLAGHASLLLVAAQPGGTLVGLDADLDNLKLAKAHLQTCTPAHCQLLHENFINVHNLNLGQFDIIFADLGVSSLHFDDATRGFSFRADGPLDMRLDRTSGSSAAELIASLTADELANILYEYGEIRQSRKLAAAILAALPTTTQELRAVCEEVFGYRAASFLPQVFQSLRVAVNQELAALQHLLHVAPTMLHPGGRLGIISFHSLEDRLVKQTFKALSTPEINDTTGAPLAPAPFDLVTKKALKPTDEEVERNPRSRSARLRVLKRAV